MLLTYTPTEGAEVVKVRGQDIGYSAVGVLLMAAILLLGGSPLVSGLVLLLTWGVGRSRKGGTK